MIDATWYTRPAKVRERTSAGGVVARRDGDRVLVALTREEGMAEWVLPKGGVKKEESLETVAKREIAEEAGLTDLLLVASLGTRERLTYSRKQWVTTHYFLFMSEQIKPEPTDPKHAGAAAWFDLSDLPILFWPEQRSLLEDKRAEISRQVKEHFMTSVSAPSSPAFLPPYIRKYVMQGLGTTPAVLSRLLKGAEEPELDQRPDPERFTLREMVAHLADFEPIFRDRINRVAHENQPVLEDRDEGQMAIDNDYTHADVTEQLAVFARERAATVALLAGLSPDTWGRVGLREPHGLMSIEAMASLMMAHDAYHLGQATEYRTDS